MVEDAFSVISAHCYGLSALAKADCSDKAISILSIIQIIPKDNFLIRNIPKS
jgi:hypothetical protein